MAEEENHYLAYLEDMYEDKKEHKKVKVRWFHHGQEVKELIPHLNPHPAEVFITPHVQVISAECIDGPTAVLTPKHYEKCVDAILHKGKMKGYGTNGVEEEDFALKGNVRKDSKRIRSCRVHQRLESGNSCVTNSVPGNQLAKCEPTYKKLRIKLSSKRATGIELINCEPKHQAPFKVDEKIELLCQDSGTRGCWFRCKVLQASGKRLQIQYHDVEDADGFGKLEEWVPMSKSAALDKLGIRCSGRLTIRPWPVDYFSDCSFDVGAAVDAWWNNGWWEGVVIGDDASGSDDVQVYFPGENRFKSIQRKNIRPSRDWVNNIWVKIQPKPDILSLISSTVNHERGPPTCTRQAGTNDCIAESVDCKSFGTY